MVDTSPRAGTPNPAAVRQALAWLGAAPAANALRDLAPLARHLAGIADVPLRQYVELLELFEMRAAMAGSALKPLLLDAVLPLPKRLRLIAGGLAGVHEALAAAYLYALRKATDGEPAAMACPPARLCARGLANLLQQYEVAQRVAAPLPPELWLRASAFLAAARADGDAAEAADALRTMKTLLALAAAQPEGCAPREAAFLAEYVRTQADAVEFVAGAGDDDYWLDAPHGLAPVAAARRPPPGKDVLHFSCARLGRRTADYLLRLERGERPQDMGLPGEAAPAAYRSVLQRAVLRWLAAPSRAVTRHRRRHARAQICSLAPLWQQQRGEAPPLSEWMILNESAGGYAVMHVAGELGGLVAGSALGFRAAAGKPWSLCIVRWTRSENPEHLELGLELASPQVAAVSVARAGGEPQPALLLPPLPAHRRGEALLTTRGGFVPGAFALIEEGTTRLRVGECTAGRLAIQTACVEIFEFERLAL